MSSSEFNPRSEPDSPRDMKTMLTLTNDINNPNYNIINNRSTNPTVNNYDTIIQDIKEHLKNNRKVEALQLLNELKNNEQMLSKINVNDINQFINDLKPKSASIDLAFGIEILSPMIFLYLLLVNSIVVL